MIKPNRSNRSLILGLIVAGGAVTLSVNAYQQPAAAAPKTLEVDKVKDNLFILRNLPPSGGNTAVFVTDAGVTISLRELTTLPTRQKSEPDRAPP